MLEPKNATLAATMLQTHANRTQIDPFRSPIQTALTGLVSAFLRRYYRQSPSWVATVAGNRSRFIEPLSLPHSFAQSLSLSLSWCRGGGQGRLPASPPSPPNRGDPPPLSLSLSCLVALDGEGSTRSQSNPPFVLVQEKGGVGPPFVFFCFFVACPIN